MTVSISRCFIRLNKMTYHLLSHVTEKLEHYIYGRPIKMHQYIVLLPYENSHFDYISEMLLTNNTTYLRM